MEGLYAQIDDHLAQYENGTITISDDIEFSMRQTVRQITHYILSRYMGGQNDPKTGARKPFRNIGNAIVHAYQRQFAILSGSVRCAVIEQGDN